MTYEQRERLIRDGIQEAEDTISSLRDELHAMRMEHFGVHPGDIVTAHLRGMRSPAVELRVTYVDTRYSKPWLRGNVRTKGGEWGRQERQVFSDWEKP